MQQTLVCVDGSAYGAEACRYAAWAARRTGAKILAVYVSDLRQFDMPVVADLSGSLGLQPYQGIAAQLQELEKEKAAAIREKTLRLLGELGVGAVSTCEHRLGFLVDVLEDLTAEADLVVLGKRGENAGFAAEHLGSMLERVVRAVQKPVLVTSREFREPQRVAFAYDGSPSCRKAAQFLASSPLLRGLDIHVVTVAEPEDREIARTAQEEARQLLAAGGLEPHLAIREGEVEAVISTFVEDTGADLLVMGAYGHSRIRHLLIGSTTTDLIRRCHVPVLCVR